MPTELSEPLLRSDGRRPTSPSTPAPLSMPPTDGADSTRKKPIGILHFAAVSFFLVAGGPIGIEYCVMYGGPLLSLVGFVVMPLMWSIPQAIMTAELSTALPDNGGYVLWAQYTFGDFCGFIAGVNGILSSLVDSTLYPTLLATYVLAIAYAEEHGGDSNSTNFTTVSPVNLTTMPSDSGGGTTLDWVNKGIALTCVAVGFLINITGVEMVSVVSMTCVAIIMLPFIVYLCVMAPEIFVPGNYTNWTDVPVLQVLPWPDVQWGAFFSTLIWSYTGYDTVGCIAGEVKSGHRTFVIGSLVTIFFVILTYSIPIVSMIMVHPNLADWKDGVLMSFLNDVGPWLGIWGCVAAVVQNLGSYYAELTANAHAMWAMAAGGTAESQMPVRHLPAWLGKLWRTVPLPAVAVHTAFVAIVVVLPVGFDIIVQADMLCNAIRLVVEFASFLTLKFRHPELPRPYTVPYGRFGAVLISVPKFLVLCLIFYTSDVNCWIFIAVANAVAVIVFALTKTCRCCGRQYHGRPWFRLPNMGECLSPKFDFEDDESPADGDGDDEHADSAVSPTA